MSHSLLSLSLCTLRVRQGPLRLFAARASAGGLSFVRFPLPCRRPGHGTLGQCGTAESPCRVRATETEPGPRLSSLRTPVPTHRSTHTLHGCVIPDQFPTGPRYAPPTSSLVATLTLRSGHPMQVSRVKTCIADSCALALHHVYTQDDATNSRAMDIGSAP